MSNSANPPSEKFLPLYYTAKWIDLGIVTLADIERDALATFTSDDPNPEHYRWRAFTRFMEAQKTITPALARDLYALGNADVDIAMGGSMMAEILRHPDCPTEILEAALGSERKHLQRIAGKRMRPAGEA
jgi:hypothetical protein